MSLKPSKIKPDTYPNPPKSRKWIRCAAEEEHFIDFRLLAYRAGMGSISPVGLLIHPKFGLWLSFRAAILCTQKLPSPNTAPDVCKDCVQKPCIPSCPAGAVRVEGWSVQRCAQFHEDSQLCHGKCHARLSCPVGSDFRHSTLQHEYHNSRKDGRKKLAQTLKINDSILGINPSWSDWSSSS